MVHVNWCSCIDIQDECIHIDLYTYRVKKPSHIAMTNVVCIDAYVHLLIPNCSLNLAMPYEEFSFYSFHNLVTTL